MKLFFFLFSVVLSFTSEMVFAESIDDLVVRDETYYKKFSDIPFTGKISGKISTGVDYGKLQGLWLSYYENGQLLKKGAYN